jgi:hypothetical protein
MGNLAASAAAANDKKLSRKTRAAGGGFPGRAFSFCRQPIHFTEKLTLRHVSERNFALMRGNTLKALRQKTST